MIKIKRTGSNFEREPLKAPFGFKGGYLDELWQATALIESGLGFYGLGIGCQSVLWSDASVFTKYSQSAGNALMYILTEYALKKIVGTSFETPLELLDFLLPEVYSYGKKVTCNEQLRMTFALNALVAVDNAAWFLYCRENKIESFDEMIPPDVRPALPCRHDRLAEIPLITYGTPMEEIIQMVTEGNCFLKIKIGSNPEKDDNGEKMLEWDKRRLTAIHEAVRDIRIPFSDNGCIPYYLDANGRYEKKDMLMRFLDHSDKIGALERIILLEEPFPEDYRVDVSDIPVRLAADESAHTAKDAVEKIDMGYKAIAIKPIAKTLSMSFRICKAASERGIPCFCADLTVNPIMLEWNKNVAARLAPLPGMKTGVLESNGHQNYRDWERLKSYHPHNGAYWMESKKGIFELNDAFYEKNGGIFDLSSHYLSLVR